MTFWEAFAAARAAGFPEFEQDGKRFTTDLAGESPIVEEISPTIEETSPTKEERIQQAAQEYKDNYVNRSLADVEFRADIDPIISGIPPALLKYQDIEKEEYNELIKTMPKSIDWSKLQDFEKEDTTSGSKELACSAGVCEVVDIEAN